MCLFGSANYAHLQTVNIQKLQESPPMISWVLQEDCSASVLVWQLKPKSNEFLLHLCDLSIRITSSNGFKRTAAQMTQLKDNKVQENQC